MNRTSGISAGTIALIAFFLHMAVPGAQEGHVNENPPAKSGDAAKKPQAPTRERTPRTANLRVRGWLLSTFSAIRNRSKTKMANRKRSTPRVHRPSRAALIQIARAVRTSFNISVSYLPTGFSFLSQQFPIQCIPTWRFLPTHQFRQSKARPREPGGRLRRSGCPGTILLILMRRTPRSGAMSATSSGPGKTAGNIGIQA